MLFNSYIFIFLFLPVVIAGYDLLNRIKKYTLATVFLTLMSLVFYGYFNVSYLFVICGSILGNYVISRLIQNQNYQQWLRKGFLIIGLVANISCIFIFKYYDFFISNMNAVFHAGFQLKHLVLPLGISFFTFQQVSYLVDSYRGETKSYRFAEYALFVSFFPQLIAGPIVLHKEMIPQFMDDKKRSLDYKQLSEGLYVFSIGLFKKVMIADTFGGLVTVGWDNLSGLTSMEALLVSLAYTFQLYFDFSGYCDMAIGLAKMFNIELTQNFNSPYKATSVIDFWNRWHMSLTRFLRVYVYYPLGGNKKGKIRTYINIFLVFCISGLWHGANWTFVLWGAIHGIANSLTRLSKTLWEKMHVVAQWFITFSFVNLMWIVFRADSVEHAFLFMKKLTNMKSFDIRPFFYQIFTLPEVIVLQNEISPFNALMQRIEGLPMWLFFFAAFVIVLNFKNTSEQKFEPTLFRGLITVCFITLSVIALGNVSTFLYFNF